MTGPTRRAILLVAGRALLLLPAFLALWYVVSPALSWIGGKAALPFIRIGADNATMELRDRSVAYTVTFEKPYGAGGSPRAVAEFEVLAPKFTYGIALFLALCLAAKESRGRVLGILAGAALLVVLPGLGIACDTLRSVGGVLELQPFIRWSAGARELIALGYQAGTLLLPTLAPIATWLVLAQSFWAPGE